MAGFGFEGIRMELGFRDFSFGEDGLGDEGFAVRLEILVFRLGFRNRRGIWFDFGAGFLLLVLITDLRVSI